MSILLELRRRNVFRVGIAYAVASWLLLQIADVLIDNIGAPDWVFPTLLMALGIGFPLALIFAWAFELTPDGIKRESQVDREASISHQTGRKLDRAIIVVLALAVGYLLVDKLILQQPVTEPSSEVTQALPGSEETPAPESASVAVLPFVNMSNDPENEYFSDGLTETLLHMLAQLPDLRVAARTSSFAFKGEKTAIQDIASALNVTNILEGSVQKSGDRVRVTAQLIRADDGFHIWSQNYTRPLEDIFAIQDEIATDVANALDTSLLGGDESLIHGLETRDLSAFDLYLRALEQQANFSYASLEQAETLLKQALAADPGFIDAKLGLARNYMMMHGTGLIDDAEIQRRLDPLIDQVRTEQPENDLARAFELLLQLQTIGIRTAEENAAIVGELRVLLEKIPTESYVRAWIASFVGFFMGDEQAALEIIQAGLLVDPLSAFLHSRASNAYMALERYDDVQASLERAITLNPNDPGTYTRLSALAEKRDDMTAALNWARRSTEVDPQDHELAANLAYRFYSLGLFEQGDRWAQRVNALAPGSDIGRALAVAKARGKDDWSQTWALAKIMVEDKADFRHGSFEEANFSFWEAASHLRKSQESVEAMIGAHPEVADFQSPPPDLHTLMMRWTAVFLMAEYESSEDTQAAWSATIQQTEATGYPWREDTSNLILDRLIYGDVEEARRIALEEDLIQPLAEWTDRVDFYDIPILAPVVDDPRVAERLAELKDLKATFRRETEVMLEGPEWQ